MWIVAIFYNLSITHFQPGIVIDATDYVNRKYNNAPIKLWWWPIGGDVTTTLRHCNWILFGSLVLATYLASTRVFFSEASIPVFFCKFKLNCELGIYPLL